MKTDRQTDRHIEVTKLIVAVFNFANALKIHHAPKFLGFKKKDTSGGKEYVR